MQQETIGFIGGGNMAKALLSGLVESGVSPNKLWVYDHNDNKVAQLKSDYQVNQANSTRQIISECAVIILSVKPQSMSTLCEDIRSSIQASNKKCIISIAAGISIKSLVRWLDWSGAIVRAMPNTPAQIKQGITGLFANSVVSDELRKQIQTLFSAVGDVIWIDSEEHMDIVTALSGSGPAYFFRVMESLIAAAKSLGLSHKQAEQLTIQTALGAAAIAKSSSQDITQLRRQVTSPGGTTEKGIAQLEQNNIDTIFAQALQAAKIRAAELASDLDN